jgi:S-layer homology domain
MVAILSRWSEQSGASPCTGGEYRDVPATHPFCGESGWMAAAGISRRYSAGTFRPSVVVTRQVALAVPIHPHRMVPVSWSYFLGAGTAVSVSGHRASRAGGQRGRSRGQHGAWRSTSAAQAVRCASRYATFDAGGHNLSPRTAPIVAGRGAAVAGLWGTGPASPGTVLTRVIRHLG